MHSNQQDWRFVLYYYALTLATLACRCVADIAARVLKGGDLAANACSRERLALAPWVGACLSCGLRSGRHMYWCVQIEDEPSTPMERADRIQKLQGYIGEGFLNPGETQPGRAGCYACRRDQAGECAHSYETHERCSDCSGAP